MFEGFKLEYVDVGQVTLRVRHGGARQPVVLKHGHPPIALLAQAVIRTDARRAATGAQSSIRNRIKHVVRPHIGTGQADRSLQPQRASNQ